MGQFVAVSCPYDGKWWESRPLCIVTSGHQSSCGDNLSPPASWQFLLNWAGGGWVNIESGRGVGVPVPVIFC